MARRQPWGEGWPCSRKLCRVPILIKGGCYIWLDCQAKYQRFEVPRLNFLVRSVSRQICRSAPQFWALSWEEGKLCRIESSWKPVITSKTSKSFFCPEFKIYVITHPTFDLSWHSCNLWCWSSDWIASGSNIIRNPSLERHLYPFHDNIIITFQQQNALAFGQPRKKWSVSWKEIEKMPILNLLLPLSRSTCSLIVVNQVKSQTLNLEKVSYCLFSWPLSCPS